MPSRYKKNLSLEYFVVPAIIILLTFATVSFLAVRGIRSSFYSLLEQQATQHAENYALQISKSTEAIEVINELLNDKLLTAMNSVSLMVDRIDNETLTVWADSLGIDEIYYYNQAGEILYSNQEHYLGWMSYPGHPVDDFRLSPEPFRIEDIRPDSESGILNKYSYVRTPEGFFQLGIRAIRLDTLVDAFEPNSLLTEMAHKTHVDTLYLLNSDRIVQSSSDPSLIGSRIEEPSLQEMLVPGEPQVMIKRLPEKGVYQVYTPVKLGDTTVGILGLTTSLAPTQRMSDQLTIFGLVAIAVIFGSLSHAIYITYKRKNQLLEMAYHDPNSGLPNRRSLLSTVLDNRQANTALLLAHVRNFDNINLVYGFHFGHTLFRALAQHVQASFADRYQVFHVAGNRFGFYVPTYLPKDELIALAKEVVEVLEEAIEEQGFKHQLDVRVAICDIPDPQADPEKIFANVSVALLHGETAEEPYIFFTPAMEEQLLRNDVIERELRRFLDDPKGEQAGRLWVEYQPIVDLTTNEVVYFEALTRMHLPGLGRIAPPEFIKIAEQQQLAVELGKWVLCESCKFLRQLREHGFDHILVSINISASDLLQTGFAKRMIDLVGQYQLTPQIINLEMTESTLMLDFDTANEVLQSLRAQGFYIAIDDFGTGYSSFARLEDLSVDIIKIDKFFVDKILTTDTERLVIGDLVRMCHRLGLKVVAEGVEEETQRQYLKEQGRDLMQGYLFSRPLLPADAIELLQSHRRSQLA